MYRMDGVLHMRIRAVIAVCVAVVAVTLSSCSSVDGTPTIAASEKANVSASIETSTSNEYEPSETNSSPTTGTDTSSPSSGSSKEIFLQVVRTNGAFPDASDSELLEAGEEACSDLESGDAFMDVVDDVDLAKGDITKGAQLVGAAVGALCPDQSGKIG